MTEGDLAGRPAESCAGCWCRWPWRLAHRQFHVRRRRVARFRCIHRSGVRGPNARDRADLEPREDQVVAALRPPPTTNGPSPNLEVVGRAHEHAVRRDHVKRDARGDRRESVFQGLPTARQPADPQMRTNRTRCRRCQEPGNDPGRIIGHGLGRRMRAAASGRPASCHASTETTAGHLGSQSSRKGGGGRARQFVEALGPPQFVSVLVRPPPARSHRQRVPGGFS